MICPSALTHSRYADGELGADEAAALERHVAECASCREIVTALTTEGRALREALQTIDTASPVPAFAPDPSNSRLLSWLGLLVLTAWAVNAAWSSVMATLAMPAWLGWLAPDATGIGIELLIGLVVSLAAGGGALFSGTVEATSQLALWIALGCIGIGCGWLLMRHQIDRTARLCLHIGLLGAVVVVTPAGHAFELRRDEARVTVAAEENIDDTLLVAAEHVLIEGNVSGDLVALGEQVTIRGQIGGNLLTIAEVLDVEGEVAGSVLSFGETLDFRRASLGANLFSIAETVTVYADTHIAGNAALVAGETEVSGRIDRDLLGVARDFSLTGNVEGNFRTYGEELEVTATARVGGDLTGKVRREEQVNIAPGAVVGGETTISTWPERRNRYLTLRFYLHESLQLLAAFIAGLVLLYVFPALRDTRLETGAETLTVMGIGAIALIATPVLAIVVTLTLIGAPLGITAFLLWLLALYASGIVTAGHVGRRLLSGDVQGQALPLLVGLVTLFVLTNLPWLGGLFRLVAVIVGLGLITGWLREAWRNRPIAE